jgi:DNA-binding MarR family transcriptional regulator
MMTTRRQPASEPADDPATARVHVAQLDSTRLDAAAQVGLALRDLRRMRWQPVLGTSMAGAVSLERGEFDTLDQVAWVSHLRMLDLADALQIDASTATRAVDRLVKRGLLDRGRDPDDGRFMRVWITDAGRAVHSELLDRVLTLLLATLDRFDDEDRAALERLLPQFADVISRGLRAIEQGSTQ